MTELDTVNSNAAWTGTRADGGISFAPLGSGMTDWRLSVATRDPNHWILSTLLGNPATSRPLYAISGVQSSIPEPGSVLLLALGSTGILIRRKR